MADLEFHGEWWSPDKQNQSAAGNLEFQTKEGGELTIAGSISDSVEQAKRDAQSPLSDSSVPDRIFGKTSSGDEITVWEPMMGGVHSAGTTPSNEKINKEEYITQRVYVGGHISGIPKFKKLSFTFPGLHDWTGKTLVEVILERDKLQEILGDSREIETGYSVSKPERREIQIPNAKLGIFTGTSRHNGPVSTKLTEHTTVSIHPSNKLTFSEIRGYVQPLRHYFTMALGKPVHPVEIIGTLPDNPLSNLKIYPQYSHFDQNTIPGAGDFNFRLSDVNLEQSLKHWFEHAEDADALHRYYFGYRYNDSLYAEFKLLSLVVALESYHGSVVDSPEVIAKSEFDEILCDIIDVMPEGSEIQNRVENLLDAIGHLPSLGTQLDEVLKEYRSVLDPLLDVDQTLSTASDLRHKIAHGFASPNMDELIDCLPKLRTIVDAILFDTIGLSEDHIQKALYLNYESHLKKPDID